MVIATFRLKLFFYEWNSVSYKILFISVSVLVKNIASDHITDIVSRHMLILAANRGHLPGVFYTF